MEWLMLYLVAGLLFLLAMCQAGDEDDSRSTEGPYRCLNCGEEIDDADEN